ncbi:unnamed protein product, partial [Prorocentrum cordatum]
VLLVDDGSSADLSPALGAWEDAESLALVRMRRNTGPAGARSVGLRLLRQWAGDRRAVVCLTDSDAMPDDRWCEAMLKAQMLFPGIFSGPTLSCDRSHTGRFHDHFGNLNGRWRWDDLPGSRLDVAPPCRHVRRQHLAFEAISALPLASALLLTHPISVQCWPA